MAGYAVPVCYNFPEPLCQIQLIGQGQGLLGKEQVEPFFRAPGNGSLPLCGQLQASGGAGEPGVGRESGSPTGSTPTGFCLAVRAVLAGLLLHDSEIAHSPGH